MSDDADHISVRITRAINLRIEALRSRMLEHVFTHARATVPLRGLSKAAVVQAAVEALEREMDRSDAKEKKTKE